MTGDNTEGGESGLPEPPEDPEPLAPLEDEDKYMRMESHLVPKVPPGEHPERGMETCNGKKTESIEQEEDGYRTLFDGYCRNPTGLGTKTKSGRCKFHGGLGGAPKHNQNGLKHGADVDPHHYAQSLGADEKEFLEDVEATICDRLRKVKGDIDFLDRVMARRVAVELHIVAKESDYVENVSGLTDVVQHEHGSHEKEAALLEDIRQRDKDVFNMLKKLGVMEDPESQKADALDSWRQFVSSQDEPTQQEQEVVEVTVEGDE